MKRTILIPFLILLFAVFSCGGQQGAKTGEGGVRRGSAYGFVKKQVEFGPRVPGTPAHAACADWFVKTLRQWTPDVLVQEFKAQAFDGRPLEGKNIIASFNPGAEGPDPPLRPLGLAAVRRPRPRPGQPFPAGHGGQRRRERGRVLLEVARCLSLEKPAVGVDILLLDLEDFGEHANWSGARRGQLGPRLPVLGQEPALAGYRARFGILLDMVGASGARLSHGGDVDVLRPGRREKVWAVARGLGLSKYFVDTESDPLIDDHLYINRHARIPTVDIIDYDSGRGGFPASWHTVGDTLDKIDKNTLAAVGRTVLAVVYQEK